MRIDELTAAISSSLGSCAAAPRLIPGDQNACGCTDVACGMCPFGMECVPEPIDLGCGAACNVHRTRCECIQPYRGTEIIEYQGGCGPNCEDEVDCGRPNP